MDELVEKVARAVVGFMNEDMDDARHMVSAALAAIREANAIMPKEPVEAMLEAGVQCFWNGAYDYTDELREAYKAMIEAAGDKG